MSSQNQLGRVFNATASVTTSAKRASLRDCAGIGFLLVNASDTSTATITEANAASGGTSQTLAGTFPYWTQAATGGVWIAGVGGVNGTSLATVANTAALLYVYIPQGALSDGFSYLACSHANATSLYIMGDLDVQRRATNLRNVTA
jgi:hypothetical protein